MGAMFFVRVRSVLSATEQENRLCSVRMRSPANAAELKELLGFKLGCVRYCACVKRLSAGTMVR